ncbi:MAG TPA: IS3 family transposase [Gammaproteobacteria bacterium]|nr:IS3 family transposase [Gammaproteobacteria bacterium]
MLEVSRSGFYAWLKRPVCQRDQRRALVGAAVETAYTQFKKRYGAPRLTVELNEQGIPCSLNHVAALLKERGLRARNGKGFRYCPRTEAMTNVNGNLLRRDFEAPAPNLKWVSDITYIKVGRIWLYLAAVMDLFSRKIVGWSLDNHMRESLVLDALNMAASQRQIQPGALIHSDRGVQYRGNEYQEVLRSYGLRCSMSRKGNCWDNAAMESFFSRLKVELIYAENYKNVEAACTGIFEYIESFYNRSRRHSAIGYISPHEYEQQFEQLTVSTIHG